VRVVCCVGPAAETVRSPAAKRRDARKRALLFDPLPERVEPCLALLAEGARWRRLGYEVKSDGYRLTGIRPGSRDHARRSRLDHPLSDNCPRCARAASRQCHPYGEAVVLDERGASAFGALQKALGGRGGKRSAAGHCSTPLTCSTSMAVICVLSSWRALHDADGPDRQA
jgi:bifunctional non-homologous end joining protein LigD